MGDLKSFESIESADFGKSFFKNIAYTVAFVHLMSFHWSNLVFRITLNPQLYCIFNCPGLLMSLCFSKERRNETMLIPSYEIVKYGHRVAT